MAWQMRGSLLRRCVSGPGAQLAQGVQALLQARHAQLHRSQHDARLQLLAPVRLRATAGGSVRRHDTSCCWECGVRHSRPASFPRKLSQVRTSIPCLSVVGAIWLACGVSEQS